jgi:5'-nucleotidase
VIILCDVDGIIADFMSANLDAIRAVTGRVYTVDQVTGWDVRAALGLTQHEWSAVVDHYITAEGYVTAMKPYPGAVDAVKFLAGMHDVYFVTTPWHGAKTWTHERTAWLIHHFGDYQGRRVIHTAHKKLIEGDIMLDDRPKNCYDWTAEHWSETALLFDRPWNADATETDGVMRVCGWDEALEAVEAIERCGP